MSFVSLFIMYALTTSLTNACITSSEEYSVETIIENYNLDKVKAVSQLIDGVYIRKAEYGSTLLTLFKETDFPKGLSVRLQRPTEIKEIVEPRIKITSNSATGTLRENLLNNFASWTISCTETICTFQKQKTTISITKENNEVSVEINEALQDCQNVCNGVCIDIAGGGKCIPSPQKRDIESVLRYANVSNTFEQLLENYRIAGTQEQYFIDIVPKTNTEINWQEAMKQELVFLKNNGIIQITDEDIKQISEISQEGQAGQNYRITLDNKDNSWKYYHKTTKPVLTFERDCRPYELTSGVFSDLPINIFYLVPISIIIISILVVMILIVISRILKNNRKKSLKR